jgi:hypothetical protein
MSTTKRKRLSELPELSAGSAVELDSFVIGEHNVLDVELPQELHEVKVEAGPPKKPTRREIQDSKVQEIVNARVEEYPLTTWTKDEWDAYRAQLADEQSKRGDKQMRAIGAANLPKMQELERKRKRVVGGTKKKKNNKKKNNKKKNNKKNNKTVNRRKRTRRGGKKTRRRNKTVK